MRGNGVVRALFFCLPLAVCSLPRAALGQACCVGASAATPARLAMHEDAAAGLEIRTSRLVGSHDSEGRYRPSPSGSTEQEARATALGTIRIGQDGQLGVQLPWVRTWRTASGVSESGGGPGDAVLTGRYDFSMAGASVVPGVGVLAAAVVPTGRPVDRSSSLLATDTTGAGVFQGALGLQLEQLFGPLYLSVTGLAALRAPRSVGGIETRLAPLFTGVAAAALELGETSAAGLSASYAAEGDASEGGRTVADSGRKQALVAALFGARVTEHWRLSASAFVSPWASGFGQNQPVSAGGALTLLRGFW